VVYLEAIQLVLVNAQGLGESGIDGEIAGLVWVCLAIMKLEPRPVDVSVKGIPAARSLRVVERLEPTASVAARQQLDIAGLSGGPLRGQGGAARTGARTRGAGVAQSSAPAKSSKPGMMSTWLIMALLESPWPRTVLSRLRNRPS